MTQFFGILGGLGPQATLDFMQTLIEKTDASKDQEHLNYIALQHPAIPDRTAYILKKTNVNPFSYLKKDLEILEKMKVDFIVIPCNTAHYFYDQLQSISSIPIINMIKETIGYIKTEYPTLKKIGVLATEGTTRANLYNNIIEENGLIVVPTPMEIQQITNVLIYDQVKKKGTINTDVYLEIINKMLTMGCELIILGCTELSVINSKLELFSMNLPIVDAQRILARKTIELCGKKVIEKIKVT